MKFRPPPASLSHSCRSGVLTLAGLLAFATQAPALDLNWLNSSGSNLWNLTDPNWSSGIWGNTGHGAVFGATGAGAIDVTSPVNVHSINFTANGYTLNGTSPIHFISGSSTFGTAVNNSLFTGSVGAGLGASAGVTATINAPIVTDFPLIKFNAGTVVLGGPVTFNNAAGYSLNRRLAVDLYVGGLSGVSQGGTLAISNSNVLPASTRLGISNGLFDLGANDLTIAQLTFNNQADNAPWNNATGAAAAGVIGTGTLRVTGEINVLGQVGGVGGNAIGANLDLGGGTQVIRVAQQGSSVLYEALQISGVISNGSLFKTYGFIGGGGTGPLATNGDGIALYGNNTYTGSTTINGGQNMITGTNATSSLTVAGPGNTFLTLAGTKGSVLSAETVQVFSTATLVLNNNAGTATTGTNEPIIPAGNNLNRLSDTAEVQLRNGTLQFVGASTQASSETFGNLNLLGGHNVVAISTSGVGGSSTLTASGNLTMTPRSTLTINSTTLGGASRFFVNGSLPTADATGILPRIVSTTDFLTYNGTTGFTPFSGYATDFSTAGSNVALTAAASVNSSVNINALKGTGSFAITIGAGQTLGIDSGMILNASGTRTITGGTLAFGANPGVFFGGTTTISSAITGTSGLINANSTVTLNGDLSGLSGTIMNNSNGSLTIGTNTFGGSFQNRGGTLSFSTSQTLAGQGAVTLGVPEAETNLVGTIPTLSISAAGANAIFGRDIIFDNAATNVAGVEIRHSFLPAIAPLSNNTGSQTISGNIILNSPGKIQGGGAGGTGATNLTGNLSGNGTFFVVNGRVNFQGNIGNAGGLVLGEGGQATIANITGTATSTGTTRILQGGGTAGTQVNFLPGSLPSGAVIFDDIIGGTVPVLSPLASGTVANAFQFKLDGILNVGTGITSTLGGVLSGAGTIGKSGAGTLVIANNAHTFTGAISVNGGTMLVNANLPSTVVGVNAGTFGGSGSVGGQVVVASGATLSPGNGVGTFGVGNLTLNGVLLAEIDLNNGAGAAADLLNVSGSMNVSGGLTISLSNIPGGFAGGTFMLVANDGSDAVVGTFGNIVGLPAGYSATIDYAFSGTDALGRLGTGNDLAVNIAVPEPSTYVALALGGLGLCTLARRRRA